MGNSIIKQFLFLLLLAGGILAQQDTTTIAPENTIPGKSPIGAVLRSAVLPGLGQIYNESYWKAPIVWGFLGYFGYVWVDNNKDYKLGRDRYTTTGEDYWRTYRNFYRDQRDLFAIYIGITYILTLLDAYVDAHLFNFNVEEDILTKSPRLRMQLNFNSIFH